MPIMFKSKTLSPGFGEWNQEQAARFKISLDMAQPGQAQGRPQIFDQNEDGEFTFCQMMETSSPQTMRYSDPNSRMILAPRTQSRASRASYSLKSDSDESMRVGPMTSPRYQGASSNRYSYLYELQNEAVGLLKDRKYKKDKRGKLDEAAKIHGSILKMVETHEGLNESDSSLTKEIQLNLKMELRDIKLSSMMLRMKCNKKLQRYKEAFREAEKIWNLLSPSERTENANFKIEYLDELRILSGNIRRRNSMHLISPTKQITKLHDCLQTYIADNASGVSKATIAISLASSAVFFVFIQRRLFKVVVSNASDLLNRGVLKKMVLFLFVVLKKLWVALTTGAGRALTFIK